MTSGFQESLFLPEPTGDWRPPTDFPRWWEAKSVTIDCETRDPHLRTKGAGWHLPNNEGGEVVGIAVECEGDARYYPIAHHGGGNLDKDMVLRWLRDVARSDGEKVFHHGVYDMGWLGASGVPVSGPVWDTMYAAPLLDEHRFSYSLDSLAMDYAGIGKHDGPLKEAALNYGIKSSIKEEMDSNIWRMHAYDVGLYGEGDVLATRALANAQRPLIKKQGLSSVMKMECELIPCMIAMRKLGVRVDQDAATLLRAQLSNALIAGHRAQQAKWGKIVNPKSADEIVYMCNKLGLSYPTTNKGNPSFVKDWLAVQTHPFLVQIHELRQIRSMQSLLESIVYQYMTPDGRIHCNFNQLKSDDGGTVSGRFSSSGPNLQQIPFRHPIWGPAFRALFIPEHGARWASLDYSQQEYRLIVHYAYLLRLVGAKRAARLYAKAGADFHQIVADLLGRPDERTRMKNLNFGLAYGMGEYLLSVQLGISLEEARPLIAEYHEKAPFMKKLTQACSNKAASHGFVRTLGGRKCRFPWWEPMNAHRMDDPPMPIKSREEAQRLWGGRIQRAYLHKAMNRVIQGGGADVFKRALLELYRAGLTPALVVHDEADGSVTRASQVRHMKEIMEETTITSPAMVVDAGHGKNWSEAHPL